MFRTSEDCKMYLPGHPDHDIRRGPVSKKEPFSNLRASVWSKNRGGGGGGRAPPLDPLLKNVEKNPNGSA